MPSRMISSRTGKTEMLDFTQSFKLPLGNRYIVHTLLALLFALMFHFTTDSPSKKSVCSNTRPTPTVMAESATLKDGQWWVVI